MWWIDGAVPAAIGLVIVILPRAFIRRTGDELRDAANAESVRRWGLLILLAAAVLLWVGRMRPK